MITRTWEALSTLAATSGDGCEELVEVPSPHTLALHQDARWMNAVTIKDEIEFHQTVASHVDRRKFFGWMAGLALPFAIVLMLFGDRVNLIMLQVIALAGFSGIVVVVYLKAMRPAVKKAREEIERRRSPGRDR